MAKVVRSGDGMQRSGPSEFREHLRQGIEILEVTKG